jgi:hypothetical protein
MHIHTYIYIYMCLYVYTYMRIRIYIYIHIHTYILINIHTYTYTYTYTYIYICIYIHIHTAKWRCIWSLEVRALSLLALLVQKYLRWRCIQPCRPQSGEVFGSLRSYRTRGERVCAACAGREVCRCARPSFR